MANPRIIKRWTPLAEVYELTPRPSRHDRERAASLVRDAEERAAAIIADAEARAAAIVWEADQEREARLEALKAAAMAQARQDVREQLAAEMDQTFITFRGLVERARLAEDDLRRAYQAELLTLAVAIAERIIGREIQTDPQVVERTVALALAHAQSSPITQIIVHPDDLAAIERWVADSLGEARLELATDAAVGRGGCVIGTKTGFIDARIATQLTQVRQALAEAIDDE